MLFCNNNREESCCAAYIAKSLVLRKIEFFRKSDEISSRQSGHRTHKLFEARQVFVKGFEHRFLAVLHFILRLTRLQRRTKIGPEFVKSLITHLQDPADITFTILIQK